MCTYRNDKKESVDTAFGRLEIIVDCADGNICPVSRTVKVDVEFFRHGTSKLRSIVVDCKFCRMNFFVTRFCVEENEVELSDSSVIP
jgi:hypothetical protein